MTTQTPFSLSPFPFSGGLTGGRLLYPAFVSDSGVTSTLSVPGAEFSGKTAGANAVSSTGNANGILVERDGKIYNLAGRLYVPQDDGFGNRYLLTTSDGTVYEINATSGNLKISLIDIPEMPKQQTRDMMRLNHI